MIFEVERIIFYLFLFAVPFQTRLILFKWTRPFNEWTAGFLYLTDILLVGLLLLWSLRLARKKTNGKVKNSDLALMVFLLISALSIFVAGIPELSAYRVLKLGEFVLLYFYLRANHKKIFDFFSSAIVISASGFLQAVIAIAQYVKQGSLGLKIFGESPLSVNMSNVAVFTAESGKYLRAYGTTPHPNVLAAWLFLALVAFYYWYLASGREDFDWRLKLIHVPTLLAFFFTFSRVVVGLWLLGAVLAFIFLVRLRRQLAPIFTVTLITVALFTAVFWPQVKSRVHVSADEEALTQRVYYNQIAGRVARSHPLLGLGAGQFTADLIGKYRHYDRGFYQPVHNIYLLIAGETGFTGVVAFLAFIFFLFWELLKRNNRPKIARIVLYSLGIGFLVIGLFDHFLWTLQQGSLLLWLVLALLTL